MPNLKLLMQKAVKTNRERDELDRKSGLGSPHDGSLGILINTAIAAIEAGITLEDWSNVAEGLEMLQSDKRILKIIHDS